MGRQSPSTQTRSDSGNGVLFDWDQGLMWSRQTCGTCVDWFGALEWVNRQNALRHCGFNDWRLPNSCELASLEIGHLALPDELVPAITTRTHDHDPETPAVPFRRLRSVTTHGGLSKLVETDGRNAASITEAVFRSPVGVGGGFRATPTIFPEPHLLTARITRFYHHVPMVRTPLHWA
nr:DUF1566 domain-containing protein [Aliiruegeria lutimaris]